MLHAHSLNMNWDGKQDAIGIWMQLYLNWIEIQENSYKCMSKHNLQKFVSGLYVWYLIYLVYFLYASCIISSEHTANTLILNAQ